MRFGLLGPLEVVDDAGAPVDVGGRQPRLALAMLLASRGRLVTVDAITEEIWGEDRPAAAGGTLQSYVSRLRRKFGSAQVIWEEPGYRLEVDPADVDFRRFERLADEGRRLLDEARFDEARRTLTEADGLWRGPALLEFRDREFATGLATRLEERRVAAIEDRFEAELRLGRHAACAGELAELVAQHPLREGLRAHLALALYRSGRQADALRALDDARRTLRDELGVDLSRPLRDLEAAILDHDPSLDLAAGQVATPSPEPAAAAASATEPVADATRRGLIGRTAELGDLVSALDESARDARIVVIEGEPGIGKTRLAEELAAVAEARGTGVAWGRGYEGGGAPALAAGPAAGPAGLDSPLTGVIPLATGVANAAQFERFEAVATFLEGAAPVVVVLDDIQWADEASLDLLTFLTTRLSKGVLLALTMRRLEVGRNDALTQALAAVARRAGSRRLQLRGLAEADTVQLLGAATGRSVDPDVARAIHSRAEGNPFYASELARLVVDERLADAGAVQQANVPAGVGAVIHRRLGHLPDTTVDLLSAAAVIGRDIELGLLTRVSGLSTDACLDRLEPALVHRLLVDLPDQPSMFRFSHALVREALLEDVSALRRARLHLRVADALEAGRSVVTDDEAEVLAEHLWRAVAVGGGPRAASALEQAAEVAIGRVAFATAEDLLQRAVDLRRSTGTTVEDQEAELLAIHRLLTVARARRYFASAASPQLIERAKDLAERTGRPDVLIDVLWVEWSAATTAARLDEAEPLATAFVDTVRASPNPDHHAFAEDLLAIRAWQSGRIADAMEHLQRSAEMRRPIEGVASFEFAGERQILGRLFMLLTGSLAGVIPDAVSTLEAIADEQRDRFVLTEIGGFASVVAEVVGDWDGAERIGRRIQAVDSDGDFSFYSSMALMGLGVALARKGRLDEAVSLFSESRARYLAVGGGSGLACHDASWAMALTAAGQLDDASAAARTARQTLETLNERWNEPLVLMAEGLVAHAQGDVEEARRRLAEAVAVANGQGALGLARRARAAAEELGLPMAVSSDG